MITNSGGDEIEPAPGPHSLHSQQDHCRGKAELIGDTDVSYVPGTGQPSAKATSDKYPGRL